MKKRNVRRWTEKERSRERERERDEKKTKEGKLRGQRAYKWAERDLLVCQSFRSHPLPWGKGRERRDERH